MEMKRREGTLGWMRPLQRGQNVVLFEELLMIKTDWGKFFNL